MVGGNLVLWSQKVSRLVNNPHHTTFNEDKGVLHTLAILLFSDAI